MKLIILISLIIFNFAPVYSYQSGNTLIIKRKSKRSKPLLERKFIILRENAKHDKITNFEQNSPAYSYNKTNSSSINALSQNLNKKQKRNTVLLQQRPIAKKPQEKAKPQINKAKNIYDESNWTHFAEEGYDTKESLNVNAKLLNR